MEGTAYVMVSDNKQFGVSSEYAEDWSVLQQCGNSGGEGTCRGWSDQQEFGHGSVKSSSITKYVGGH